jgi:hypothetical protein
MATRLTYTTGLRSPELDRAFERALADVREREDEPLMHLQRPLRDKGVFVGRGGRSGG